MAIIECEVSRSPSTESYERRRQFVAQYVSRLPRWVQDAAIERWEETEGYRLRQLIGA